MIGKRKPILMGIDVGTQSVRVGFCDAKGKLIYTSSKPYMTFYPKAGWAEQKPIDWWNGISLATKECIKKSNINPFLISGISFCATSSTIVPVDQNGIPLDRAILWMDKRAVKEVRDISRVNHKYLKYVGGQDSVEWMVPKILWLKRNKPNLYKKSSYIVEATDWIAFKLTGNWIASQCNATCKSNYVSREGGWDKDFFEEIGLSNVLSKWPTTVMAMGEKIGTLTKNASIELGIPEGIPIIEGGIDAHVGFLALNALEPTKLGLIMGSSNVLFNLQNKPIFNEKFWGPYPDAIIKDKWLIEGGQSSTGSIINWFVEIITQLQKGNNKSKKNIFNRLDELEDEMYKIAPGSDGLLTLDYWQGNRTPRRDPEAKGIIFGLTLAHGVTHILRSFYEGISFGTKHIIQTFEENGIKIKFVSAGGGATKSKIWLQLTADICNMPISIPYYADKCGVIGSTICAAYGSQIYKSFTEAVANMTSEEKIIYPSNNSMCYNEMYKNYLNLYEKTKDMF